MLYAPQHNKKKRRIKAVGKKYNFLANLTFFKKIYLAGCQFCAFVAFWLG
jgi:hypothetical protein